MRRLGALLRSTRASAAAELALLLPLLILLFFGTLELGNLFMTQHALSKHVGGGARFATRLTLADSYSCPASVFDDPDATTKIISVTQNGSLVAEGAGRLAASQWASTCDGSPAVAVSFRCVEKGTTFGGLYTELDGDIPVVEVEGTIEYLPILANAIGFDNAGICLSAQAEAPVIGL